MIQNVRFTGIIHLMGDPDKINKRLDTLSERYPLSFQLPFSTENGFEAIFIDQEDVVALLKDKYQFDENDIPADLLTMSVKDLENIQKNDAKMNEYALFLTRLRMLVMDFPVFVDNVFNYFDTRKADNDTDATGQKIRTEIV